MDSDELAYALVNPVTSIFLPVSSVVYRQVLVHVLCSSLMSQLDFAPLDLLKTLAVPRIAAIYGADSLQQTSFLMWAGAGLPSMGFS